MNIYNNAVYMEDLKNTIDMTVGIEQLKKQKDISDRCNRDYWLIYSGYNTGI